MQAIKHKTRVIPEFSESSFLRVFANHLSTAVKIRSKGENKQDEFITIPADLLSDLSTSYCREIRALIDAGYVERTDKYFVGKRSYGYRPTLKMMEAMVTVDANDADRRLSQRIVDFFADCVPPAQYSPAQQRLIDAIPRVTLPENITFDSWAFSPEKEWHNRNLIDVVRSGQARIFFDQKVGRAHSTFSSMSKEVRAQLLINGQRTVEIDFSQMHLKLLLGFMAENRVPESEINTLRQIVEENSFYPLVQTVLKEAFEMEYSRDEVKPFVYHALYSSFYVKYNEANKEAVAVRELFKINFPNLIKCIREHRKNSRLFNLARMMMEKEVQLRDEIIKRLGKTFCICIYDSFRVQWNYEAKLKNIMEEVMDDLVLNKVKRVEDESGNISFITNHFYSNRTTSSSSNFYRLSYDLITDRADSKAQEIADIKSRYPNNDPNHMLKMLKRLESSSNTKMYYPVAEGHWRSEPYFTFPREELHRTSDVTFNPSISGVSVTWRKFYNAA